MKKVGKTDAVAQMGIEQEVTIPRRRILHYSGRVSLDANERVYENMKPLIRDSAEPLYLTVTSSGGPSGAALSFYDMMRAVLRPKLVTIGMGDVDSSGVLIFLSGTHRYISRNTTLLLHPAGRCFDGDMRYTAVEIAAMAREDHLKDAQYASVVAERSSCLSAKDVLGMMQRHTVLTAQDMVAFGLAEKIL